MVIPKLYGGLGFSAHAHSAVIVKLSSRSVTAAVTVMVPNSLGPGELLVHYGTDEQKSHYLEELTAMTTTTLILLLALLLAGAAIIALFTVPAIRRVVISAQVMKIVGRALPTMGDTERIALEAGTVWWDGELTPLLMKSRTPRASAVRPVAPGRCIS